MGDYSDRARSRLTTGREAHDRAMRDLSQRQCDSLAALSHMTQRWAERMGQYNNVLETGDATVDSSGIWGRDFRAPYAAVAVSNRSDADLRVVSGGRAQRPGDGAGSFTVPARTFGRYPLVGTSVTVYGTAGAVFSYSVLAGPCPPYAAGLGTDPGATGAALANVAASVASVVLAAANAGRRGLVVVNDSATATLYVALDGSTASATNFSYVLLPGDTYEMARPVVTGAVTGVWDAAVGTARVTETS